jgi:hypothetical protein
MRKIFHRQSFEKGEGEQLMDMIKVAQAIGMLDVGVKKYIMLMEQFRNVNVSTDTEFQRFYNGFYRMRQRQPKYYQAYYTYMEASKGKAVTFDEIVRYLYDSFGRIEASFSSKMLATLNPDKPVWDSIVLQSLGLKKPTQYAHDRLGQTIRLYEQLEAWYKTFLKTEEAKKMLEMFNSRYPDVQITDVKKIDLILWRMR